MKKIVVLGDYERVFPSSNHVVKCKEQGFQISFYHDPVTAEEAVEKLYDAEIAVLVRERVRLSADMLKRLPKLKMISQTGTGLAHIDLEQAKKQGITITITPRTSVPSVVELTFGLMISVLRMFSIHQDHLRQGLWNQIPGFELKGKRLGILGFGEIGKEVAKVAQAFGMETVVWRPTGKKGDEGQYGVQVLELNEVLATSDIVSLHLRLVPSLAKILNRERLREMKKGSVLINTSRGALVDTNALAELLRDGHLLGAGIDTFEEEPLTSNPFQMCKNVVLTPHIGYITWEVLRRFAEESLQNILEVSAGNDRNVVKLD